VVARGDGGIVDESGGELKEGGKEGGEVRGGWKGRRVAGTCDED